MKIGKGILTVRMGIYMFPIKLFQFFKKYVNIPLRERPAVKIILLRSCDERFMLKIGKWSDMSVTNIPLISVSVFS